MVSHTCMAGWGGSMWGRLAGRAGQRGMAGAAGAAFLAANEGSIPAQPGAHLTKRLPGLLELSATPILQRSTSCAQQAQRAQRASQHMRCCVHAMVQPERQLPAAHPLPIPCPGVANPTTPLLSPPSSTCRLLMWLPLGPSSAPTRRSGISMMRKHTEVRSRMPAEQTKDQGTDRR